MGGRSKGLQRAGPPEEKGPWPSSGRATEPVDWSTGWPGRALGISKVRGPACGPSSWAGWAGWAGLGKN